ncbi:hypothetical protein L1049_023618 [Liquidambar formosana]|uniref:Uncharacterized protein n=1 Tax=Liquidambar formosana TaxID=63359 RepID=A0AAP0RTC2_LIQFO
MARLGGEVFTSSSRARKRKPSASSPSRHKGSANLSVFGRIAGPLKSNGMSLNSQVTTSATRRKEKKNRGALGIEIVAESKLSLQDPSNIIITATIGLEGEYSVPFWLPKHLPKVPIAIAT